MLENTQFKELKLNVNKTNMVKLCKFYFHEILNKKLSEFLFFKYQRDSFYVLECSGYEFHLFVNCCKVLLTERNLMFLISLIMTIYSNFTLLKKNKAKGT